MTNGKIWEVRFSTGMSLGPPETSYWIRTRHPEVAITKAKRLLQVSQRDSGYARSEIRRYRITSVKLAGEIDG